MNNRLFFSPKTQLPLIIFGENHYSPLVRNMISTLIPDLKELGYNHFGLEYDNSYNLNEIINEFNTGIIIDRMSFLSLANNTEKDQESKTKELNDLQNRIKQNETLVSLLQEVKKNGWSYKGLDLNLGESRELKRVEMEECNQIMAKHIIESRKNGFNMVSLIGAAHISGLAKLLAQTYDTNPPKVLFIMASKAEDKFADFTAAIIDLYACLTKEYSQKDTFKFMLHIEGIGHIDNIKNFIINNIDTIAIKKVCRFENNKEINDEIKAIKKLF